MSAKLLHRRFADRADRRRFVVRDRAGRNRLFAFNSPAAPQYAPIEDNDQAADAQLDPRLQRQIVNYASNEAPGTVIIDTPHTFLYYVLGNGKAIRYGIGVGRQGFTWSGVQARRDAKPSGRIGIRRRR